MHAVRPRLHLPLFRHDSEKQAVLEDAVVLASDKKTANLEDLLPLLEQVASAGSRCCSWPRTSMARSINRSISR
jgi:hypothetical protein